VSRVSRRDRVEDKRIQCHAGVRDLSDLNTHTIICFFFRLPVSIFILVFISNNVPILLPLQRHSKVILSSCTRTTRLQRR
jgi:hypothetical protein